MRRLFLAAMISLLPLTARAQVPPSQWSQDYIPTLNDWRNLLASNSPLDQGTVNGRTLDKRSTDIIMASDSTYAGGVKCDGVTDDSPALQAALNAGSALGGRTILLPATKHACLLNEGVQVSDAAHSGNILEGTAHGLYWPGPYDNTESDWTQFGTWIHCADLNNACITVNGNGSAIRHLSFWYTQPTPPGSPCGAFCTMSHGWAPTQYPFTILVSNTQNFNALADINVVNGTNCIDFEGGATGVNTIYTYAEHLHLGCFNTVARFNRVDNVIDVHDWHDNLWWYPFNPNVIGYTEGDTSSPGHKIGCDMHYLANLQGSGIEFYQDAIAMFATDQTVGSGLGNVTFGAQVVQLANVQFNQVCEAMGVAATTTHLNMRLANVMLNVDPQTSNTTQCAGVLPNAFNLASSNVDVGISNLQIFFAQTIAAVGANNGTTGGVLRLSGVQAQNYSAYETGSAFLMQGGYLDAPQGLNWLFSTNPNAGPHVAGAAGSTVNTGLGIEGLNTTERALGFYDAPANGGGAYDIMRWQFDDNGEGGRMQLRRFSATGTFQDIPIDVDPSTGQVYFVDGIKAVLPTSCTGQSSGTQWNNAGVVNVYP